LGAPKVFVGAHSYKPYNEWQIMAFYGLVGPSGVFISDRTLPGVNISIWASYDSKLGFLATVPLVGPSGVFISDRTQF